MYTILLVDDEESVLDVLRSSVNWQELGVETLLTASDGIMALEQFEHASIDLLIADIRMPRMDGLTLIRRVRELSPETHCILLTAYGEFEYAKEAINLGVENYLLKPIIRDEIEMNVQNALNNIYQKRHSSDQLLMENTLRRWTQGNIGSEELSDRAVVLGINLYRAAYCVVCMVKKNKTSMKPLRDACVEALSASFDVNGFWDEKERYVMIVGGRELVSENLTECVWQAVKAAGGEGNVAVAIGAPVSEPEVLHLSYQIAVDAIELSDPQDSSGVLSVPVNSNGFQSDLLSGEVQILLFEKEEEIRVNGYRHLAMKMCRQNWSEESGRRLVRACIQVLVKEFPGQKELPERIYREAAPGKWPEEAEAVKEEILVLFHKVHGIFMECMEQRSPIVQRTIYYIRDGVFNGEGISLRDFCTRFGMNPSYLGHIFKMETGLFFNDYLMRCRIERSIVLLRNPNRKIKDIAEDVGFAYASYYIKCFRSYKGISPTMYRQELLKG